MQLRNRGQWETGAQRLCLVWDTWGGGGEGAGSADLRKSGMIGEGHRNEKLFLV